MPTFRTTDATTLHYLDWGEGPPIVLCHGWALGAASWEYQMLPLCAQGFRCVALDKRGSGRSDHPGHGYDFDTLADDLAALLDHLDLDGVTVVAHSMASGEVTRYLARHGAGRVARVALVAPTTPCLQQADGNPGGIPPAFFDAMVDGILADRPAWMAEGAKAFFGTNLDPAAVSEPLLRWGIGLILGASAKATVDLVRTWSRADLRPDMGAYTMPTLVIHGDADQLAPLDITGRPTAAAIPHAELQVYPGAPHGLFLTHATRLNGDIAAFAGATDRLAG